MTKKTDNKENGIKVKCPKCGNIEILADLSGWSFIILKEAKCSNCKATITHEDVLNK